MKKKMILVLLFIIVIATITGCSNNKNNSRKQTQQTSELKTKLSCYHETYLFHSKKSVEHILSLNKDNKLIGYEYIEKYYEFDETGGDFNLICDNAPAEAENNNKMYPYLKEVASCNKDSMEVTISDLYDMTKLKSKKTLKLTELIESLDDNYIVDIENFKGLIGKKGYICENK